MIDSLVLKELSTTDKQLVDSCLKVFHHAKDDTNRIRPIEFLVEQCWDDKVWPKYNLWVYSFVQKQLKIQQSKRITKKFKKAYASALNNIGYNFQYQGHIPKALEYYHKSLKIQEEIGDKKGVATSLTNIGIIYFNQGEISKVQKYYHKSLKILEEIGDKTGIATCLNNIGQIYSNQGDIINALDYHHKSLKLREEIDDKRGISTSLNNIGLVYDNQDDNSNALKYYYKSLKLREKIGDKRATSTSLSNIGGVYQEQGNRSKALEYYNRSLKLSKEIGDKRGLANCLNNIGIVYFNQGDPSITTSKEASLRLGIPIALDYYYKSLRIQEEIGDKQGIAYSLNNIGSIELKKGSAGLVSAKKHLLKALDLAQQLGYPGLISDASSNLSKVYDKQGKGMLALKMFQLHITMKDSINNEATQKASMRQQSKYEYEKQKALDDAEHDKILAIEQEEKAKQKVIAIAAGVGLVLVIAFLAFVFNRLRITRIQKIVIEEQKHEVEEAHQEITDSINYAERIQRSFLATDELLNENLGEHFVFFQPKEAVSGDFYWAGKLSNGNFAMVNADSTGHGVPGAIMSILNISSIENSIEMGLTKPSEIFNEARTRIINRLKKDGSEEGGKDGMDASIIVFDKKNNKFTYTAAQNPIWVIRDEEVLQLKPEKMPVGKHDNDSEPFVGGEFETQKGDIVYTLTDGYQDQFGGPKGKKFMVKKMRGYILSISHLSMQEQHQAIKDTFNDWKGSLEQIDDVCVIGVKV